ncbi:MAG: 50S ribosomal protein L19 [Deltaproteobacteria bacterium]|nr:50S ribosomal protein L19 [Deltaproteobacteria bacterium]
MSKIIQDIETSYLTKTPDFRPGDTIRVNFRILEGDKERVQMFEGVCIARRSGGNRGTITVRKVTFGQGVERIFPLCSPRIEKIDIVQRGRVRRAKLFYLRGLKGKKARIKAQVEFQPSTKGLAAAAAAAAAGSAVAPKAPTKT